MTAASSPFLPDLIRRSRRLVSGTLMLAAAATAPPAVAANANTDQETLRWRIEQGDTLITLQKRLLRSPHGWQDLQRFNSIVDPRRLRTGQTLEVPLAWLRGEPLSAQVEHLNGGVTLRRAGTGPIEILTAGATVRAGDVVRTDPKSSASLRLGEGSRLLVRPGSQIVLEASQALGEGRATASRVRLEAGSVDTTVPPATPAVRRRVDVRTPVVNLGVRGTSFRSSAGDGWARVEVLEGRVDADAQRVGAGEGTRATPAGVEPPRPLLPAPDLQAVPVQWSTLDAIWPALSGAAAYRAQVLAGDGTLLRDGLFAAPRATWDDALPDGEYRLVVRGVDADGFEGRDVGHPFVLRDDPVPVPLAPLTGTRLEGEAVEFDWRAGAPALPSRPTPGAPPPAPPQWRLQVAADATFATLHADRAAVRSAPVRVALEPGPHQWRVARVYPDGRLGPWSPATAFELRRPVLPPPAPPVVRPVTVEDGVALLGWSAAPDVRVRVQTAADQAFATTALLDTVAERDSLTWTAPAPGRYWVRTSSIGADGRAGPFSDPVAFDVDGRGRWWLLAPALLFLLLL